MPIGNECGFLLFKPTIDLDGSVGRPGSWWIELVYADSLCGLAQVIRDPKIPANIPPGIDDVYYGMPQVMGACPAMKPPIVLKGLNDAEKRLLNVGDAIEAEDI